MFPDNGAEGVAVDLSRIDEDPVFASRVEQLIKLSRERHVNSFSQIEWPESIPDDEWWLPPELLSVHGTEHAAALSERQLKLLSKWECINAFSLNVEGERELINMLSARLYAPDLPEIEHYIHHFIDEENKHLWFFGEFCRRYGGKIYSSKKMGVADERFGKEMEFFLLFARIFIFEEIGGYYNVIAGGDTRVSPFVRLIHQIHHADEARHITFGRAVLTQSKSIAFAASPAAECEAAIAHLQRFVQISIEALYQPAMYRDSGIAGGVALRRALLADPARRDHHASALLKRPLKFMAGIGIPLEANPA
ncbi:diiron oxygenase [Luteimonas abyssi]|uniref:diiron oxygenase n=1 Tax=Luteimonas abyssi TaxID=1247514 RepID=UPI000737BBC0|nr:diiron oxygenase [Luteimonas abyssi]